MGDIITFSEIREEVHEPDSVILYALKRYGPEPSGRVGHVRYWHPDQWGEIKKSIARTAKRSTLVDRRPDHQEVTT